MSLYLVALHNSLDTFGTLTREFLYLSSQTDIIIYKIKKIGVPHIGFEPIILTEALFKNAEYSSFSNVAKYYTILTNHVV